MYVNDVDIRIWQKRSCICLISCATDMYSICLFLCARAHCMDCNGIGQSINLCMLIINSIKSIQLKLILYIKNSAEEQFKKGDSRQNSHAQNRMRSCSLYIGHAHMHRFIIKSYYSHEYDHLCHLSGVT